MEKWKDIPGYEGIYQASTEGRIRSSPGKTTHSSLHGTRVWKTRILKGRGDNPKTGKRVNLWKNKTSKDWLVARLVAMTWIPGEAEGLTVNHINGNRMDNRVCNLEWLSLADNIRHGFQTGLYRNTQKQVALKNLQTGQWLGFPSMAEASRFLGKRHDYVSENIGKGKFHASNYEIIPL